MDEELKKHLQIIEQALVYWVAQPRLRARSQQSLRAVRDELDRRQAKIEEAGSGRRARTKQGS